MHGDRAKAVLTGLGLAFGLGWLWFPWLGGLWLPGLLWGGPAAGGGGAFLLLLVAGFGLGGVPAARLLASKGGRWGIVGRILFASGRRLCHVAAYLLLLAALFLRLDGPGSLPGIWPYFALPAAGAAYVIAGLYWGGRLVALPPALSASAFFVAVVAATAIGQAAALLSLRANLILWPHGVSLAAILAEILARRELPQPKSRGRPPKQDTEARLLPVRLGDGDAAAASRASLAVLAAVMAGIGFAGGAALALYGASAADHPAWMEGLFFCAGAFVPSFAAARPGDPNARGLLSAGAAAAGLIAAVLALAWHPSAGVPAQLFAEGAVSGLGLCLLAGANQENGAAIGRAGAVLAAGVAAVNCGRLAGAALAETAGLPAVAATVVAVCLALLLRPLGLRLREMKKRAAGREDAAPAAAFAEPPIRFTDEEARIVELLAREGLSNQDIAGRLFITRSTVRYHLKKIYAKTNTANREELAAFIARKPNP